MNWDYFTQSYWEAQQQPETWAILVGNLSLAIATIFIALATFFGVVYAAKKTFRYTQKHSKNVYETQFKVERIRREIDALEKIWELMDYISLNESEKSIVIVREKSGEDKVYYFHYANLKDFYLKQSTEAFYKHHAGLHLPNKIRDLLFDYQRNLKRFYFSEMDNSEPEDGLIKFEKVEYAEKLIALNDKLHEALKAELKEKYDKILTTTE